MVLLVLRPPIFAALLAFLNLSNIPSTQILLYAFHAAKSGRSKFFPILFSRLLLCNSVLLMEKKHNLSFQISRCAVSRRKAQYLANNCRNRKNIRKGCAIIFLQMRKVSNAQPCKTLLRLEELMLEDGHSRRFTDLSSIGTLKQYHITFDLPTRNQRFYLCTYLTPNTHIHFSSRKNRMKRLRSVF